MLTSDNKTAVYLLSFTYWGSLLILAPVTVFGLGAPINYRDDDVNKWVAEQNEGLDCATADCKTAGDWATDFKPWSAMWVGVVIFWALNIVVFMITFFMKKGTASDWYKNVLFYGAYELADLVANKSDELREEGNSAPQPCWKPVFIFWWSFSIKYFIPWALLSLMMWNFKADINLSFVGSREETNAEGVLEMTKFYRGYGKYNDMWQLVGFIYPLIGLICFIVPICVVTTPEESLSQRDASGNLVKRLEVNLEVEEDPVHR